MSSAMTTATLVPLLTFGLAFVFGAAAQRTHFCTLGAVADINAFGDWRRMRMWALAIAVAIAGAHALQQMGLLNLGKSFYTGTAVPWVSHLIGGFLFGVGMALASGCGAKSIVRAGGGNMKSWVVLLVFAISAYMSLKGLFGVWRVTALDPWRWQTGGLGATQSDLSSLLAAVGGWPKATISGWLPYLIALALAAWAFASPNFREQRDGVVGSVLIGATVAGTWYVSGVIGYLAEDPNTLEEAFVATNSGRLESLSFSAPLAYTLELLMLWSDKSRVVTLGIAGVLGMLAGATVMSLLTREFRWEGFTTREDLAHHLVGGALMGFGGVTAMGCTIGQGLTGISTLAIGSVLSLAAIIGGAFCALRYLAWRAEYA
ncbi:MAG: YeeE/YedE family protein [Betaproteobacteria bacterium]|nr:YeeE/YedE family protein [Betaproteobacteria bacterium]